MSYAIQTSETYKLSFGILVNINFLYIDYAKLNVYNTNDSSFLTNLDSKYSPNFGVGIYFRSQKTISELLFQDYLKLHILQMVQIQQTL